MKRFTVEFKIITLIVFAVVAVLAAGYLAYGSIKFILNTINKEAQPNLSLIVLKEINNSLQIGESNIDYFILTGESKYLKPYYEVITTVDKKIELLYLYNRGNKRRNKQIDNIRYLIEQKFIIWDKLLNLSNTNRVDEVLVKLTEAIETATDSLTIQMPKRTAIFDTVYQNSYADGNENKKSNFFARLFKKKSPEISSYEKVQNLDSILIRNQFNNRDTSIVIGVNKERIQSEIVKIIEEEDKETQRLADSEIYLRRRNNVISRKLETLFFNMEKEEMVILRNKASEADKMVEFTNKWSAIFLLMFFNLLLGVVYVIQRYIRKSHATQKALTRTKDEALKLSRTKEQFLANMSHEIRTPMNAIVGFTDQILKMPLDDKPKEQLEIVRNSADHLLKIINDILDFSKLEAGKITLEVHAFSFVELLVQAYQLYKPSADLKSINFDVEYPTISNTILMGDSYRLRQIIFNLLSNAIKFTSEGEVLLKASVRKQKENSVLLTIEVRDTGIGIAEDKIESIFEEFSQANITTTRNYGGTGLGLAIVKKLVHLHEGTIKVGNNKNSGGACFLVSIEYNEGNPADLISPVPDRTISPELLSDYRMLVADDDEYNRKLIQHILDNWGVRYTIVDNGKDALSELIDNIYDLVLLDIQMPVMSGLDVATSIRKKKFKGRSDIPIIALTATTGKNEVGRIKNVGINEVLSKPFNENQLLNCIFKILNISDVIIPEKSKKDEDSSYKKLEEFHDLYKLANNDRSFVRDMLKMFIRNSRQDLQNMHTAIKQNNWEAFADLAHKIKSPCKHLNAMELSMDLKQLELMGRKDLSTDLKNQLNILFKKVDANIEKLIYNAEMHLRDNF